MSSALNTLVEAMHDVDPVLDRDARAELVQLRASVTELKERCDELTEMAIGRDAEIERLHYAIEALTEARGEQARRLASAREAISESSDALDGAGLGGCYASQACRAWLDATAPAQQVEKIE